MLKFDKKTSANFSIAIGAVVENKMRAFLTGLGIVFGVAAVIAMLSIGAGAKQEILEQMKLIGANNIIINPIEAEQEEGDVAQTEQSSAANQQVKYALGLSMKDVNSLRTMLPHIRHISPEITINAKAIRKGLWRTVKMIGVENSYFDINNLQMTRGTFFSEMQMQKGLAVCIIGSSVAAKFFTAENPIGKRIKCKGKWLMVVGVLENRSLNIDAKANLGIRDINMDIYIPLNTVLRRYQNNLQITQAKLYGKKKIDPNQLTRLVTQTDNSRYLSSVAEVASRMLERKHQNVVNFEVVIPELLLKQQQKTSDIFNMVLAVIAGISLLVGGIGIMNIMLASVLERIREIGVRLAVGAKKKDVVQQFLFESVVISLSGGIIGILLGVTLAVVVAKVAEIPTVITLFSILLSFGVAVSIGLLFGIFPARKAAQQDPIKSLRYE